MNRFLLASLLILSLLLGYVFHRIIRRFIDPKQSAGHAFLYFLAHFIAVFVLAFVISLAILKFSVSVQN